METRERFGGDVDKDRGSNFQLIGEVMLNELAKSSHDTAKSKGWWSDPRSEKEILMLILSEIAEATEEVRSGSPHLYAYLPNGDKKEHSSDSFPVGLKAEGEAVELADAVIRILDYSGYMNFDLDADRMKFVMDSFPENTKPLEFHYSICKRLCADGAFTMSTSFTWVIIQIYLYGKQCGWDLWDILSIKAEYNKTRAWKHGKLL